MVKKYLLKLTHNKKGLFSFKPEDIKQLYKYRLKKQFITCLPPDAYGGNHSHSRTEVFVSYDKLSLIWIDENNKKHKNVMGIEDNSQLKVFVVKSNTPHAVLNETQKVATLIELADGKLDNVKNENLI